MSRLDESRFVQFLEAVYALEHTDEDWLTHSLRALSHICGSEHSYMGFFYDASNVEHFKAWNRCRFGTPPAELGGIWDMFTDMANADFVRSTFRCRLLGSARDVIEYTQPLLAERQRKGYGDFFCLNALDPSGLGCLLTFGCRDREFSPRGRDAALLKRAATHLSAAYRCRRRLTSAGDEPIPRSARHERVVADAEAILDTDGRFVHAEGRAQSQVARERIRNAAVAIDSARTAHRRQRGVQVLDQWHPLTSARWTLLDSFEEGGRRYIVARENQAELSGFGTLTDRERQILVHAALGLTNKEIAYTLGVSDTTVRVLLSRAAKRLGVRGRKGLLAHSALRELCAGAKSHG
ncbi:MAG TPA: LuxR C-terminal-related transcriptional regulator [Polyangiaceae bacterium]|nr:LuxR C-terminal-related transcriptional regulator [Polyangiaceae bacterium]